MPRKLALAAALVALGIASAPAAAQAASPRCEAKEGDTIARNATTRVFTRATGDPNGDGQDLRIFSCRLGTRSAVLVERIRNTLDGTLRIQEAKLGSTKYFAVLYDETTGTSDATDVYLYDVTRPGNRIFAFSRDGLREGLQFEVTRNGGLAVLDGGVVTLADGAGRRVAQPSGASELAWAPGGNRVYWYAGGIPLTTTLSGHPEGD
jgi:hypothetical protein